MNSTAIAHGSTKTSARYVFKSRQLNSFDDVNVSKDFGGPRCKRHRRFFEDCKLIMRSLVTFILIKVFSSFGFISKARRRTSIFGRYERLPDIKEPFN